MNDFGRKGWLSTMLKREMHEYCESNLKGIRAGFGILLSIFILQSDLFAQNDKPIQILPLASDWQGVTDAWLQRVRAQPRLPQGHSFNLDYDDNIFYTTAEIRI